MPLGNVLDTELKHKQNHFARRIKYNSQADEKREMLTIYNACGAEKKNGLTPHCPPSLREFELQTIWFLGWCCINHLQRTCWPYSMLICDTRSVCCYINRRLLYKHWNVFNQDQSIKTEIPVLQSWFLCLCSVFIILAQSWNLPTCFLGRSGSCGREFGGIVYRC